MDTTKKNCCNTRLFKYLAIFILTVIPLTAYSLSPPIERSRVLRVGDRNVITFSDMIKEIVKADVIVVGETHDDMSNHRAELDVIRMLHVSNVPIAIGLEMFTADSQKELDDWVKGSITVDNFLKIYHDNWTAPWFLYESIFFYAREHRIPMVGLNLPDRISKKVFESGFGSLTADDKKEIPPGIGCTVDEEYRHFIGEMYTFHQSMSGKSFSNFCEAQMLWDSVMAVHIIKWLNAAPGTKIIALVGVGHAWKRGIADQIKRRSNYHVIVVLPDMPDMPGVRRDITIADADYLLFE